MAQLPPNEPASPTYPRQMKAVQKDLEALWRRMDRGGKGGSGLVLVQPDEPEDAEVGTLWFDTDAGV